MIPTTPTGDLNLEQMQREYSWRQAYDGHGSIEHYSRLTFVEWFLQECERDWPYGR